MNIIDTTYRGIYSVSLNLNELCDRGINADKICITSGNNVILHTTGEILVAMRDKLNELFPPESDEPELSLPEEPKEDGYYLTPQSVLLIKDTYSWYRPSCRWKDGTAYTGDWGVVSKTLGAEAFPLTKLNTGTEH